MSLPLPSLIYAKMRGSVCASFLFHFSFFFFFQIVKMLLSSMLSWLYASLQLPYIVKILYFSFVFFFYLTVYIFSFFFFFLVRFFVFFSFFVFRDEAVVPFAYIYIYIYMLYYCSFSIHFSPNFCLLFKSVSTSCQSKLTYVRTRTFPFFQQVFPQKKHGSHPAISSSPFSYSDQNNTVDVFCSPPKVRWNFKGVFPK